MTIETDLDNLVGSTTLRKDTAVSAKSNLSFQVSETLSSRDLANLESEAAETVKIEAATHATTASNAATASVGVTAVADLTAVALSKAENAVDVFVYDTSKDSDGGVWRYRTTSTSWYNEELNTATRGARREFPAVAVIVAEDTKVTIYDGDNPSLPMWMVFRGADVSIAPFLFYTVNNTASGGSTTSRISLHALNGVLSLGVVFVSGNGNITGYRQINLLSDELIVTSGSGFLQPAKVVGKNIANRNTDFRNISTQVIGGSLVNITINDIAMTVLPDAPVDSITGLPVPTIAVATNGGVSVIKEDGTVVDLRDINTGTYGVSSSVQFLEESQILFTLDDIYTRNGYFGPIPNVDTTVNQAAFLGANGFTNFGRTGYFTELFAGPNGISVYNKTLFRPGGFFVYSSSSVLPDRVNLHRVWLNFYEPSKSLVVKTTAKYTTGWLNNQTKGAFLSSTDTTKLTDNELVKNGGFDTAADWIYNSGSITGGVYTVTADNPMLKQDIPAFAGQFVDVTFNFTQTGGGTGYIYTDSTGGHLKSFSGTGSYSFTGLKIGSSGVPQIRFYFNFLAGGTLTIDNISVKLVDADRSINNNRLLVNGTITRTPVATGSELVGYSGFSDTNYLEQPYNSDLDFGTGEWNINAWIKVPLATSYTVNSPPNGTGVEPTSVLKIGNNLVTNGDFSEGVESWTISGDATASVEDGWLKIDAASGAYIYQAVTVEVGKTYLIEYDTKTFYSLMEVGASNTSLSSSRITYSQNAVSNGTEVKKYIYFTPYTTTVYLKLSQSYGGTAYFDNVTLHEVSDMVIAERSASSGPYLNIAMTPFGKLVATAYDGTTTRSITTNETYIGNWINSQVCYKSDGSLSIYINGKEVAKAEGAPLLTLNNNNASLFIGNSHTFNAPFAGSLALFRISTTAPTANQIAKIYEDERSLFEPGARCTLYGSSDAVTALAYDEGTNLLHVGTSAGRSVFDGLVRVDNTTTPVTNSISAVNGFIVEN